MITADDIFSNLNLERVNAAVRAVPAEGLLMEHDYDLIAECLYSAVDEWVSEDIECRVRGIENRIVLPPENPVLPAFHGVIDLVLECETNGVVGDRIIDYKTTTTVDKRWADRQEISPQVLLYTAAWLQHRGLPWEYPIEFEFRGIERTTAKTRIVLVRPRVEHLFNVVEQYRMEWAIIRSYKRADTWPQHAPDACYAYNRVCPWFASCHRAQYKPAGTPDLDHLSYSSLKTFHHCPELFRLQKLTGQRVGSHETTFGEAFHAGMANIYQQIWGVGATFPVPAASIEVNP